MAPGAPPRTSPPAHPAAGAARPGAPSWREQARARSFRGWDLPLTEHHVRRLELLESLVGKAYRGWGQEPQGPFFVDVAKPGVALEDVKPAPEGSSGPAEGIERFKGETLHKAIGAAIRATQGVFR